ncbi:AB hydrolase-1 domain-containing protein [Sphingomonas antarctica]|uniref:alpha/beta fold hydrolase n=1 Tax=Sphingomonas antarctica TaxID=2040274 RepID=UPI0039E7E7CF
MAAILNGLAAHRRPGSGPTLVFLPGYASDMAGTKAVAVDDWAGRKGRAMVRFDYRGCGLSEGKFEDFTLEDWRDDALRVIDATTGPVVLVGSSMGGWLMLLAALARPEKVVGLVGIAAAPDFTDWDFIGERRAALVCDGRIAEPSPYGGTTIYTHKMWESGQRNLLLGAPIALDCPVRLIHGQADPDVPWQIALDLAAQLRSDDVQVILVKDGDHRLSRPQDIALLVATVKKLLERL